MKKVQQKGTDFSVPLFIQSPCDIRLHGIITSLASNKVLTVKILFDFHKTCKAGLFTYSLI